MKSDKYNVLIKGVDKTAQIRWVRKAGRYCYVSFLNSDKEYCYCREDVVWQPKDAPGESSAANPGRTGETAGKRLDYFHQVADAVGIRTEEGGNLLSWHYNRLCGIPEQSVLERYLGEAPDPGELELSGTLIYPFGINLSQKKAVENAFSRSVSIIQGPPGTGKTQTILNIIANAVCQGKTVAVVSSNNSATANVVEKLEKKGFGFITAFLGRKDNKERFVREQTGRYPALEGWRLEETEKDSLQKDTVRLEEELDSRLKDRNRVAEIARELKDLETEERYFRSYAGDAGVTEEEPLGLSSAKIMELLAECEGMGESGKTPGIFGLLRLWLVYNHRVMKLLRHPDRTVMIRLQLEFYRVRREELAKESIERESRLEAYAFNEKLKELEEKSLALFRHHVAGHYESEYSLPDRKRRCFESSGLRMGKDHFSYEYPVILSTTYSLRNCLEEGELFDYLIVDEASQVDLATGVLALSCGRNAVIVGDLKQLPNVISGEDTRKADPLWNKEIGEDYRFTAHSLLSSAAAVWKDKAPSCLLREHYRCHPQIINFCNRKFYNGELVVMTEEKASDCPLKLYRTVRGNHARGRLNQREIDVISREILPDLLAKGKTDIGIITPYRDQANALGRQLDDGYEVDTVHKFQGREKDVIILSSVDNEIGDFVDDPNMLNVAVSRAVDSLIVVTTGNSRKEGRNYTDLARYIEYNNFEVMASKVYSIFDLLYGSYARQRWQYLKNRKRISEFDSENLMYSLLTDILKQPAFAGLGVACHVPLHMLIRDVSGLPAEEAAYARHPWTHTDFLVYSRMDKHPVMAVEVDGVSFHQSDSRQGERDRMKDHIFATRGIRLLRLRTDGSGEREKIAAALQEILGKANDEKME